MKKIIISISILIILLLSMFTIKTTMAKNAQKHMDDLPEIQLEDMNENDKDSDEVDITNKNYDEIINIALLGLDGNGYDKDKRSDVIIIATINTINNSLKLTSVSRDTLVYQPITKKYDKLNHAYPKNKSEGVVEALNVNLDLDIEHYVTFDYNSVITAVDFFGGFPANVTEKEAKDMNREGNKVQPGEQMLSGKDALTYVRIRQNSGGDPGRNQRQRDLIIYIMEQSQTMKKADLLKFATKMLPLVKTSYTLFDIKDLLDLYVNMRGGLTVEQFTYPFEYKGGLLSDRIWYATPQTVETNVKQFHEQILGKPYYDVPRHIEEINYEIIEKTGIR